MSICITTTGLWTCPGIVGGYGGDAFSAMTSATTLPIVRGMVSQYIGCDRRRMQWVSSWSMSAWTCSNPCVQHQNSPVDLHIFTVFSPCLLIRDKLPLGGSSSSPQLRVLQLDYSSTSVCISGSLLLGKFIEMCSVPLKNRPSFPLKNIFAH